MLATEAAINRRTGSFAVTAIDWRRKPVERVVHVQLSALYFCGMMLVRLWGVGGAEGQECGDAESTCTNAREYTKTTADSHQSCVLRVFTMRIYFVLHTFVDDDNDDDDGVCLTMVAVSMMALFVRACGILTI